MKVFGKPSLLSRALVGLKLLFCICLALLAAGIPYLVKIFGSLLMEMPFGEAAPPLFLGSMIYLSGAVALFILWHLIQGFRCLQNGDAASPFHMRHWNLAACGMGVVGMIYLAVSVVSICTVEDLLHSAVAIALLCTVSGLFFLGAIGVKVFSCVFQALLEGVSSRPRS